MTFIEAAVEGVVDAVVARRLIEEAGGELPRDPFIKGGRGPLLRSAPRYRAAARYTPWLVLCDLDRDQCAPGLLREHVDDRPPLFCFRVAVRTVEAWLLADPGLARFLQVQQSVLPANPDGELYPKIMLLQIARSSRSSDIRERIGGTPGRHEPGAAYNELLSTFARDQWDPVQAAERSDSLRRAIVAVERLAGL